MIEKDTYQYNYHYDTEAGTGDAGYYGNSIANVYKVSADSNQFLEAVSIPNLSGNIQYTIEIYTNDSEMKNPQDGVCCLTQVVNQSVSGIHTVVLNEKVFLEKDTYFSVVVSPEAQMLVFYSDNYTYKGKYATFKFRNEIEGGQSFYYDGKKWCDIKDESEFIEEGKTYGISLMIRAMTNISTNGDDEITGDNTITFMANGGKGVMEIQTGEKGSKIKLNKNEFTRPAHEFLGWECINGEEYDDEEEITLEGNISLKAKWKNVGYNISPDWYNNSTINTSINSIKILMSKEFDIENADFEYEIPNSNNLMVYKKENEIILYGEEKAKIYVNKIASNLFPAKSDIFNIDSIEGLKYLDTSKTTDMSLMFERIENIKKLDLSHFVTSTASNMSGMFSGCSSLIDIDFSSFDTSNVIDMSNMFSSCSSLETLDLTYFTANKVKNATKMFQGCTKLKTIKTDDDFDLTDLVSSNVQNMFTDCIMLVGGNGTKFDSTKINGEYARVDKGVTELGYFTHNNVVEYYLRPGWYTADMANSMKKNEITKITISKAPTRPPIDFDVKWDIPNSNGLKGYRVGTEVIIYVSQDVPTYTDEYSNSLFSDYRNVNRINGIDILDTSKTEYMSYMFENCSSLETLDLSKFNTSNVTYMPGMFRSCKSLRNLDLSSFDTRKVINMSSMFSECMSLTNLDLSSFDTSNVTEVYRIFDRCESLITIDLSNFNTSKVTNMNRIFFKCSSLINLDLSSFYTSKVTNMSEMFYSCYRLTTLDLSNFNTSKVTNMSSMFYNCSSLTDLDLSSFDTSKVTNMLSMFVNCSSLTDLDLSSFDTRNVTDMSNMFENCSSLETLDLSKFNTSNVTYMPDMFRSCKSLRNLDLSSFDTSKVTNMSSMFSECMSLTNLDLSSFDTRNVTDMSNMFYNCSSLTDLDLSSFDTSNVINMYMMFYSCGCLTTIVVSDKFVTDKVTKSGYMFSSSFKLVGGDGTIYDGHHCDKEYARIDGKDGKKGYFTYNVIEYYVLRPGWYTSDTTNSMKENEITKITISKAPTNPPVNFEEKWDIPYSKGLKGYRVGTEVTIYASQDMPIYTGTDSSYLFSSKNGYFFRNVKIINGIDILDTSKTTNMFCMFQNCSSLETLDLSSFDTSKVTDMSYMFVNCSSLENIDLSNFDTSKVTDMFDMFANCSSLKTLDLSNFDTSDVTRMFYMFYECSSLTSIDLRSFDTSKVTDMSYMFYNCSNLETLDLSSFDTSKVTDMSNMFSFCRNLNMIIVSDKFTTDKVTNSSSMFDYCDNLVGGNGTIYDRNYIDKEYARIDKIGIPGYFTSEVEFYTLSPGWYTADIGKNEITKITISKAPTNPPADYNEKWDIPDSNGLKGYRVGTEVTIYASKDIPIYTAEDSGYLFSDKNGNYSYRYVKSIDAIDNLDTSKTTNMSYMFYYCESLNTLDLSNFDTSSVTNMYQMFSDCSNLTKIIVSDKFTTDKVTNSSYMFSRCVNLIGSNGTTYNDSCTGKEYARIDGKDGKPGYFTGKVESYTLSPGWYTDNSVAKSGITKITISKDANKVPVGNDVVEWVIPDSNGLKGYRAETEVTIYATEDVPIYTAKDSSCLFSDKLVDNSFINVKSINGIDILNTLNTTDMSLMFSACKSLETIDLSSFDTSNVTNMNYMFYRCENLKTLDLSSFDTNNVVGMSCMFCKCSSLITLDLSSFDTSKVTKMNSMFSECRSLTSLDLSGFDTSNVTDMNSMFCYCSSLEKLNSSKFNTSKVINMSYMFEYCESLTTLDLSSFDTSNVTSMYRMFIGCRSLTSIDLSSFDTSKVTYMSNMFDKCSSLISLDLSSFDTRNVISVSGMFYSCESLKTLDLSSFDTSNVTNMLSMFVNCSSLEILDLSSFDTSKVTDMYGMFVNCSSLETLNLSSFDTSKVTDMTYMFYNCSSLIMLDLSSFDTSSVTGMSHMFYNCSSLTKIIASDKFTTDKVTSSSNMFNGCTKLKGGKGTKFDSVKTNVEYARVDKGTTRPGYFTSNVAEEYILSPDWYTADMAKSMTKNKITKITISKDVNKVPVGNNVVEWDIPDSNGLKGYRAGTEVIIYASEDMPIYTAEDSSYLFSDKNEISYFENVNSIDGIDILDTSRTTNMTDMFDNCSSLETLDLSSFNTSRVTNMSYMFNACYSLRTLKLSKFDISEVTNMSWMFGWCESLTTLDLSNFNANKVTDMSCMFYYCKSLNTLDLGNFNMSDEANMSDMFYWCSSLDTIDLSSFDTGKVTKMNSMFAECRSLRIIKLSNFNTNSVREMGSMFYNCGSLITLDLSSFDTSKVTHMSYMFHSCSNLTKIIVSDKFTTDKVTSSYNMFYNCTKLEGGKGTKFDSTKTNGEYARVDRGTTRPGYFTSNVVEEYILSPGWYTADMAKSMTKNKITKITISKDANVVPIGNDVVEWDIPYSNGLKGYRVGTEVIIYASQDLPIYTAEDSGYLFSDNNGSYFTNVKSIDGIGILDTSKTVKMTGVFNNCSSLDSLDLSKFNTSRVTNMQYMFNNCSSLIALGLSSFDTSTVTNMWGMFNGCKNLTILDLSSFNTSSVQYMLMMFQNCQKLNNINISNFDTGEVIHMGAMFSLCKNLTTLDLSNFDTSKVTDMSNMFNSCSNLTKIIVSDKFTTDKVANSSNMFNGCTKLKGGKGTKFDSVKTNVEYARVDKGTTRPGYFTSNVVEEYILSPDWYTDNSMAKSGITKITISKDVNKVPVGNDVVEWDIPDSNGLKGYRAGTEVTIYASEDLPIYTAEDSSYLFSDKNDISYFENVKSIDGIDILDTSKTTNMTDMFDNCSSLETLDLSSFDTSNVRYMDVMFISCSSLTSFNLSSFDTRYVTTMHGMFWGCSSLINLDLSNFDTSSVTDMSYMFVSCSNLTKIIVSDKFTKDKVIDSYFIMFNGCTKLKGGKGTTFDSSKSDGKYARIDWGDLEPGYFTYRKANSDGTYDTTSIYEYTITYDTNDGTLPSGTSTSFKKVYKVDYTGTVPTPIKDNCDFVDWYTDSDLTTKWTISTDLITSARQANATIYAKWVDSYWTITYEIDGGTWGSDYPTTDQTQKKKNVELILPTADQISKSGYTFLGWYDSATVEATTANKRTTVAASDNNNKTFYAHWQKNWTVNVRAAKSTNVNADWFLTETLTMSLDTTRYSKVTDAVGVMKTLVTSKGYTLGGRYVDASNRMQVELQTTAGNYRVNTAGNAYVNPTNGNNASTTITGIYIYVNEAKVTWTLNGGTAGSTLPDKIDITKVYTLPTDVTKSGCTLSWDLNDTGSAITSIAANTISSNPTLVAHWGKQYFVRLQDRYNEYKGGTIYSSNYFNLNIDTVKITTQVGLARTAYEYMQSLNNISVIAAKDKADVVVSVSENGGTWYNYKVEDFSKTFAATAAANRASDLIKDIVMYIDAGNYKLSYRDGGSSGTVYFEENRVMPSSGNLQSIANAIMKEQTDAGATLIPDSNGYTGRLTYVDNTGDIKTFNFKSDGTGDVANPQNISTIVTGAEIWIKAKVQITRDWFNSADSTKRGNKSKIDEVKFASAKPTIGTITPFAIENNPKKGIAYRSVVTSGTTTTTTITVPIGNGGKVYGIGSWNNLLESYTSLKNIVFNSNVDTSAVTSMLCSFQGCSNIESIDLSTLNLDNVTNFDGCAKNCPKLTAFKVAPGFGKYATDMHVMFQNDKALETIDLSNFNTEKATNLTSMFNGCKKLTDIKLPTNFASAATKIEAMFANCDVLATIDISNMNVSKVTNAQQLFWACPKLTTIYVNRDVEKWFTVNNVNTYGMFGGCSNLKGGAGTKYNSSNVDGTYARVDKGTTRPGYFTSSIFEYTITYEENGGTWKKDYTSSTKKEYNKELTLPTSDHISRSGYTFMGWYESNIATTSIGIKIPASRNEEITLYAHWGKTINLQTQNKWGGTYYSTYKPNVDVTKDNWHSVAKEAYDFAKNAGITFNPTKAADGTENVLICVDASNSGRDVQAFTEAMINNPASGKGLNSADTISRVIIFIDPRYKLNFRDGNSNGTIYFTETGKGYPSTRNLKTIAQGIMKEQTDAGAALIPDSNGYTGKLTYVDADGSQKTFDFKLDGTGSVANSDKLDYIVLEADIWINAKVQITRDWFNSADSTKRGDKSKINEVKFAYAKPTIGTITPFAIENNPKKGIAYRSVVTSGTTTTITITVPTGNGNKVYGTGSWQNMFENWTSLTKVEIGTNVDADEVTKYEGMFNGSAKLTTVNMGSTGTGMKAGSMYGMFRGCSSLKSFIVPANFGKYATTMGCMFQNCSALQSIDLSNWVTTPQKGSDGKDISLDMAKMFINCSNLTSVKFPSSIKFGGRSTNMSEMFAGCSKLASIDLTNLDTSNSTTIGAMFRGCSKLTTVNINSLNTSKVTGFNHVFQNCTSLSSMDVSKLDFGKATTLWGFFEGCSGLKTVTLSGNFSEHTSYLDYFFKGCSELATIYVDSDVAKIGSSTNTPSSTNMFTGCSSLVGGMGTTFNSSKVTGEYARVDEGTTRPGYFTIKVYTLSPGWYMASMRKDEITKITISKAPTNPPADYDEQWDIPGSNGLKGYRVGTEVIIYASQDASIYTAENCRLLFSDWSDMFMNVESINGMDLLDTSKTKDMSYMFYCCNSLTTLDLSEFDTSSVTSMSSMFLVCGSLKTIIVSDKFTTDKVTNSNGMFSWCYNLVGGNGTTYDSNHTGKEYARIDKNGTAGYFTLKIQ